MSATLSARRPSSLRQLIALAILATLAIPITQAADRALKQEIKDLRSYFQKRPATVKVPVPRHPLILRPDGVLNTAEYAANLRAVGVGARQGKVVKQVRFSFNAKKRADLGLV